MSMGPYAVSALAPTSKGTPILAEAPAGRHIAQLHKNPKTLVATVAEFIGQGLGRGDAVLAVASSTNTEKYLHRLRELGFRPGEAIKRGQLVVRDSEATRDLFMRDGMPQWPLFRDAVGSLIRSTQKEEIPLRVYGEMVNDLWRATNQAAAIRLEIYWNEIVRLHRCCLLCCYELGHLDKGRFAAAHDAIGRTHSDLLPSSVQ